MAMVSNMGLGVMIGLLAGNEKSVKVFRDAIGKIISALEITDKELLFTFDDGSRMKLFDDGQSCCEYRYMHTDDDLTYFIGSILQGAEVGEGPTIEDNNTVEESEFLIISTNKGQFTIVNYNEHNGYYGGFLIRASIVSPD